MARLWAFIMALMSPVSPSENSVNGIHWDSPPPAAEPLMFIVGPPEGCRMQATTFLLRLPIPWSSPIVVVDFPSPRGVGVMAVTSMNLPSGLSLNRSRTFI